MTLWLNLENKMQLGWTIFSIYTHGIHFLTYLFEFQYDLTRVYIQHGDVFPSVPVVTYCHTQAPAALLYKETEMEWFEWGMKDRKKDVRKEFRQIPQSSSLGFSSQCFIHLWLRQTEIEQWDLSEISWWFL